MENQHRKIKGYRELSQEEIDLMNKVKEKGAEFGNLIDEIKIYQNQTGDHGIDIRWLSIGQTHIQQGLMAVTRSIAKPDFF